MRYIIVSAFVIVSTMKGQAMDLLPVSVQQFLQEREYRQRSAGLDGDKSCLYRYVPSRVVNGCEMVDAFVGIEHEGVVKLLEQSGVIVNCLFDGFVTAQIPVNRLEAVARIKGVQDLEISCLLRQCTDSTMSVTHVNEVLNGSDYQLPAGYDGTGVIVGIVDKGFDYQHRAFRSNENPALTRISRVYSTTLETGHPARYNKTMVLPGSVFMGDEIDGLTTDSQGDTHGTHTASIAAGSHVSGYGGMAPGAEIVLCSVSVLDGSMSVVEVTNCLRYIKSYADSVGRPCVMSLSVSTPYGQRDGMDYLSQAVKQLTGPGCIFVISAGNDGGRTAYAHKLATPDNPLNVLFKYRRSNTEDSTFQYYGLHAEIWMRQFSKNFFYRFHVLDQQTSEIVWESDQLSSDQCITTDDGLGDYFTFDPARDSVGNITSETGISYGKYCLGLEIRNLINREYTIVNGVKRGRYAIGMSIYPRDDDAVEIDAWACNSGTGLASVGGAVTNAQGESVYNYYSTPSDSCCIGTYAVGDSTISAGAFAARNSYYSMASGRYVTDYNVTVGDIASFSAYQAAGAGPTGQALPTICAPGITVVAAGSRFSYFAKGNANTVMQSDDGSFWGVMSGTSMAAPTVAGIIALWLQVNPNLSVAEVKHILGLTAIKDYFTNGGKHSHFGPNGKINALGGMKYILRQQDTKKGDVNGDGYVNVSDVTMLIKYVLEQQYDSLVLAVADMEGDGLLNVTDVVKLISLILNQ